MVQYQSSFINNSRNFYLKHMIWAWLVFFYILLQTSVVFLVIYLYNHFVYGSGSELTSYNIYFVQDSIVFLFVIFSKDFFTLQPKVCFDPRVSLKP
jgi:hypothetical protein